MKTIKVLEKEISLYSKNESDYICLTDIARYKNADGTDDLIRGWLRNRNTIEFLGIWEQLNNTDFKPVEFDGFRKQAGLNSFTLTPKQWIEKTGAIGLISKAGRYGGTFAHKDIAFEFAAWISVEFKLYLIKEFQRLQGPGAKAAWLGHPPESDQDQLPHSYRCHQRKPDPTGTLTGAGQLDLRIGSGPSEHGPVRHDRQAMARRPP